MEILKERAFAIPTDLGMIGIKLCPDDNEKDKDFNTGWNEEWIFLQIKSCPSKMVMTQVDDVAVSWYQQGLASEGMDQGTSVLWDGMISIDHRSVLHDRTGQRGKIDCMYVQPTAETTRCVQLSPAGVDKACNADYVQVDKACNANYKHNRNTVLTKQQGPMTAWGWLRSSMNPHVTGTIQELVHNTDESWRREGKRNVAVMTGNHRSESCDGTNRLTTTCDCAAGCV